MNEIQRCKATLSYGGTHFHGWAKQPHLRTVQGEIEEALATIFRRAIELTVAGRTDAGVHAREQVCHFDLTGEDVGRLNLRPGSDLGYILTRRLNKLLNYRSSQQAQAGGAAYGPRCADLVIHRIELVDERFDARFSALSRRYIYRFADTHAARDPRTANWVMWLETDYALDLELANAAAQTLLGEHDFLSYCRPKENGTTIRTLHELKLERQVDGSVHIFVRADAFCHSMVRSLVGALLLVGQRKRPVSYPRELLDAPGRQKAAPIAPAGGLSLEGVEYPTDLDAAAQQQQLSRRRREQNPCG